MSPGGNAPASVPVRLLVARALRGFADGCISVVLVHHLDALGFSPTRIGVVVTATLLGSAALTLTTGLAFGRLSRRTLLLAASALMAVTGLAAAATTSYWPLVLIAFAGTLNPSANDLTVFLPTEQALLASTIPGPRLTSWYARINVAAACAGAVGTALSSLPDTTTARRLTFVGYALVAVVVAVVYRSLPHDQGVEHRRRGTLATSRRSVVELAALFSLDSAGGGLAVQSLLVLYLDRRFDLDPAATGLVLGVTTLLGGLSQLLSSPLATRIGLVRTMAYTHLPANVFLLLAGVVPTAGVAVALLCARACLSSMDVPARQSLVMALVPPDERAAAASITNVPRSLASALMPVVAGLMLEGSSFGWPLVAAGALKITYDLLLLARWRHAG